MRLSNTTEMAADKHASIKGKRNANSYWLKGVAYNMKKMRSPPQVQAARFVRVISCLVLGSACICVFVYEVWHKTSHEK
jgi:hypothetical protein